MNSISGEYFVAVCIWMLFAAAGVCGGARPYKYRREGTTPNKMMVHDCDLKSFVFL